MAAGRKKTTEMDPDVVEADPEKGAAAGQVYDHILREKHNASCFAN